MIIEDKPLTEHVHTYHGWKLAPARQSVAGEFYVGPVNILSGLVQFPITSIQFITFESRFGNLGVVRPVDRKISFHA